MGLPGHRRTSSDKRRRSAHFGLKTGAINLCPKCAKPILAHRACKFCGTYKGRQVVKKATSTTRKTKAK
jgi:large subunit ribosomal protein L32